MEYDIWETSGRNDRDRKKNIVTDTSDQIQPVVIE